MCGGFVDWCAFSWEAFATLATGLAAVIGAYSLGRRQIKILGRQTALQESQIKVAVFERRMDVFRAVEKLIHGVFHDGGPVSYELERGFVIAQQEARFLFANDTNDFLKEVWTKYVQLKVYDSVKKESFEETGQYGQENIDKTHEALTWLAECSSGLAGHFAAINPIVAEANPSP